MGADGKDVVLRLTHDEAVDELQRALQESGFVAFRRGRGHLEVLPTEGARQRIYDAVRAWSRRRPEVLVQVAEL